VHTPTNTHCPVSGSSTNVCKDVYQGESPLSAPEASALANTVRRLRNNIDMYFTIHSFGQQILVPYGYATGARPPNYENMVGAAGNAESAYTHVRRRVWHRVVRQR
jgi:carboxypeptidase A